MDVKVQKAMHTQDGIGGARRRKVASLGRCVRCSGRRTLQWLLGGLRRCRGLALHRIPIHRQHPCIRHIKACR